MPTVIKTPIENDSIFETIRSGDFALISGTIYTARDAAHQRMLEAIKNGQPLPFDIKGQIIYYAGPSPARPGMPIGSIGPTTSYRMDPYAPELIKLGLKGMIGKGSRNEVVKAAIKKYRCIYFGAIGGAAAYLAKCVKHAEVVAYEDLGPEAVRKLLVENFPVFVINDIYGGDLYQEGRAKYSESNLV